MNRCIVCLASSAVYGLVGNSYARYKRSPNHMGAGIIGGLYGAGMGMLTLNPYIRAASMATGMGSAMFVSETFIRSFYRYGSGLTTAIDHPEIHAVWAAGGLMIGTLMVIAPFQAYRAFKSLRGHGIQWHSMALRKL